MLCTSYRQTGSYVDYRQWMQLKSYTQLVCIDDLTMFLESIRRYLGSTTEPTAKHAKCHIESRTSEGS